MRIIALLFISCLLVTTMGYQFAFRLQMNQLKTAMKRTLRQKRNRRDVVEFSFDSKEVQQLQWEDKEEFSWQGHMYDVLETRMEGDKLIVLCIPDKQEDQLLKEFQKATEKSQHSAKALWIKLMTAPYTCSVIGFPGLFPTVIKTFYRRCTFTLTARSLPIVSPPPEVC